MADHAFSSFATLHDPLAQLCNVPGCNYSEKGHPAPVVIEPVDVNDLSTIQGRLTEALKACSEDIPTQLEQRVTALEATLEEMRGVMLHHGLRGPQK